MAKPKNYYLYSTDKATLDRLDDEYRFIGRHTKRIPGGLVVLALPPQKVVKKKFDKKSKSDEARTEKPRERDNR